ncbi:hypothetical protein UFOVP244_33 [uncultured Caudovirales phage]|uniref:Uncharacterized protein n=1 Tax=uncultured Caudovirales phage TaxID=2100421 RepID=A0A6J7X0J2_9CAUD|nr:hypothetical protein UFOVP244_33 [uncultured Caudovirales phage]
MRPIRRFKRFGNRPLAPTGAIKAVRLPRSVSRLSLPARCGRARIQSISVVAGLESLSIPVLTSSNRLMHDASPMFYTVRPWEGIHRLFAGKK